ncbi:MED6 mediator sub complex component domain-containing protein [Ditylenchus destructor]|uniref:Mediator of RNA polymerase II transcription subunit 6 n=1 Tax=Ditylenchus destructor TaxID=166010 RepID=A0AAD4N461_9BILA|nr:MED6 mediator sub complex component domain-containing protein [Ditylenchus destructor]
MDPSRIQELTYKNPNFPASQLNEENIMIPYFCDPENPFYQRQNCDNETLRMQNITNPIVIQEMLTKMIGIQYTLHVASPPLFVIMKHKRTSQQHISPLCYYYVMEAKLAGEATEEDQEANVADGDLPSSSAASMTTSARDDDSKKDKHATNPLNVRATAYQRTRTDMLLKALMEQFPPQSMAVSGAASTSDVKMEK